MPPIRFWFVCLKHFIVGAGGALTTQLNQLSGTDVAIAASTWILCIVAGLVAAAMAGGDAWPKEPPRSP